MKIFNYTKYLNKFIELNWPINIEIKCVKDKSRKLCSITIWKELFSLVIFFRKIFNFKKLKPPWPAKTLTNSDFSIRPVGQVRLNPACHFLISFFVNFVFSIKCWKLYWSILLSFRPIVCVSKSECTVQLPISQNRFGS